MIQVKFRRGDFGFDTTDPSGRFVFEGVPGGTRTSVVASKEGFAQAAVGPFTVEAGRDRSDLELRLGATASMTFVLKDENDRPVADVEVSLADPERRGGGRRARLGGARPVPEDRIEPGEGGALRVRGLDPGVFDVTVVPWGHEEIERPGVHLKAGETSDLGILRAKEGTSISGKVLDPEGRPVAEAQVFAMWIDGECPRMRMVKARGDGSWKLAGLGETPIRELRASARGYTTEERLERLFAEGLAGVELPAGDVTEASAGNPRAAELTRILGGEPVALSEIWPSLDRAEAQQLVELLVARIVVGPDEVRVVLAENGHSARKTPPSPADSLPSEHGSEASPKASTRRSVEKRQPEFKAR